MTDLAAEIREAWGTHNRIHLYLIERISDDGMLCTLSSHGGRNVVRQFCHLHNVRRWHLENRRAKDLAEPIHKFDTYDEPDRDTLTQHLEASADAVETFLLDIAAGRNDRRAFKKGLLTTLAYFISHESHHRGNILLTLKQSGHGLPKDAAYGIWGWDQR